MVNNMGNEALLDNWYVYTESPTFKWDQRFLQLAQHISGWSKDPSTKVGAVLVGMDHLVVGLGYNGFPRGVVDNDDRLSNRDTKYQFVVHAEANAILMAGDKAKGATLYVYPAFALPPICSECAKLVIQSGIKEIVGYEPDPNDPRVQRWKQSIGVSEIMCREAGVTWRTVHA